MLRATTLAPLRDGTLLCIFSIASLSFFTLFSRDRALLPNCEPSLADASSPMPVLPWFASRHIHLCGTYTLAPLKCLQVAANAATVLNHLATRHWFLSVWTGDSRHLPLSAWSFLSVAGGAHCKDTCRSEQGWRTMPQP